MKLAKTQVGMTLLEILVALAVFATAAMGILSTISSTSIVVEDLETRTFGHYLAGNRLAELSLQNWPRIGVTREEKEMAGRTWYVTTKVEATPRPDMRRITVVVSLDDSSDEFIVDRIAFVGNLPR